MNFIIIKNSRKKYDDLLYEVKIINLFHLSKIFEKSDWKTRDQGTLATTFWHFNLQHNHLLSEKYNYIIDYFCDNIKYDKTLGFTKNNFKTNIQPKMVHVFHRFGDKDWDIWNVINSLKDK